MSIIRPFLFAVLPAATGLFSHHVFATNYAWTADATGGPEWTWGDSSKWSPVAVPNAADADVSFALTGGSPTITLGGSYAVNNMSVTADGGRNVSFASVNTAGSYSLAINGVLRKNNGSSSVSFFDYNTSRLLNLTINTLNFTNTGGGNFNFGRNDGGRRLNSLAVDNFNMGASDAVTATVLFNVTQNYSLGHATFIGTNSKSVYLINNSSSQAGYSRTATVKGITQATGSVAATIYGSNRASTSTNAATLKIDTDAGIAFTASTNLADGAGGTLALLKTGAGKQILSGALTHTGGTQVDEGTLVVAGSLANTGDLAVASGATFVAGAALSLRDIAFESGAVLGFDLGANASLNLSGNLTQSDAGSTTFVIDFQNTGVLGQTYTQLLSIAGANAFDGATLSYINFGAEGYSGTLNMVELTGSFTVSSIPELSTGGLILGVMMFLLAGTGRHFRFRR